MLKRVGLLGAAVCLSLFLTGCTPTLDTSSEESIQKSLTEMTKGMTAEQKVKLQEAMMKISFSAIASGVESKNLLLGAAKAEEAIKQLDGMTSDEIIETAKKLK